MNRRWVFYVGAAVGAAGGVYSLTVGEWSLAATCGFVVLLAIAGLINQRGNSDRR